MNRTLSPFNGSPFSGTPEASSQIVPSQNFANWFERQAYTSPVETPLAPTAHSCFAPVHYESGYAYPLIVWLHGPQSNEDELRQVMPLISMQNHLAIAPRGTRQVEGLRNAYDWGNSADDLAEAGERVQHCIAIAQERFNVHPDRVFIAGHAAGGTLAHRLGLAFPEQFAGAISLGGPVPRGSCLLKNINRARNLPLLLAASPREEGYSTEQVKDDLRFLHSAGLSLSLRLYPAEDELTTVMFSDLNHWVMEQFCSASTAQAS